MFAFVKLLKYCRRITHVRNGELRSPGRGVLEFSNDKINPCGMARLDLIINADRSRYVNASIVGPVRPHPLTTFWSRQLTFHVVRYIRRLRRTLVSNSVIGEFCS